MTLLSACARQFLKRKKLSAEQACAFRELLKEDFPIEIASVGDRPPRTVFARMLV